MDVFKLVGSIFIKNDEANEEIDETTDRAEQASGKLGKAFGAIAKGVGVAVTAGATAVSFLTKGAIEAYADYEQLTGGVETLFGTSADKVMEYANKAYQTAGLSANEYMETVTSFSASLLQGLGGDTAKASEVANLAITDMSDNANKMGTSMEAIQNAYQGFAKQNYTMLDNLKLGYGGTQEEMVRLINDSGVLEKKIKSMDGISFDTMISAIHKIQDNMGITGTTALEASTTISGSLSSLKSAWSNTLVAMGNDGGDFNAVISQLVDSAMTVVSNILPRIQIVFQAIPQLVNQLSAQIPAIVSAILPSLLQATMDLLNGLVSAMPSLIGIIMDMLPILIDGVMQLVLNIVSNLPAIIEPIISALPEIIMMVVNGLLENAPALIAGVIQLMMMLVAETPQIVASLIDQIPVIIQMIVDALDEAFPMLMDASIELFNGLVDDCKTVWSAIKGAVTTIFAPVVEWFAGVWDTIKNIVSVAIQFIGEIISLAWDIITLPFRFIWENCKDTIMEVWNAIVDFLNPILETIASTFSTIWNKVKDAVTNAVNAIKTTVSRVFNAVKSTVSSIFDSIKSNATSVWNNIKTAISEPMDKAKEAVKNAIEKIKGFFNFEWSLPKLKMPHFSVSGSFSLNPPSVPKFGIEWYKKAMDNPLMFTKPTLFDVNPLTGSAKGAGEAGDEVMIGKQTMLNMMQDAVRQENATMLNNLTNVLNNISDLLGQYIPELSERQLVLDTGAVVGGLAPAMDTALGSLYRKQRRGV